MKILLITPWFPSIKPDNMQARQGIFEYRQTIEMSKRGHEQKIVAIKWRNQLATEQYPDNIQAYRISPIFVFPQIRYPIPNFIALDKHIRNIYRSWKPDIIVYSHMYYLTALPILWFKKVPSLVSTDGFAGISWFYGDNKVDLIGKVYTYLVIRNIIKASDGLQLFSHKLLADEKTLKMKFKNAFVCSTGVDTDLFKSGDDRHETRTNLGLTESDIAILFVGRFDLVKGVEYFIEAAKAVLLKNKDIKLFLVGDGSLRGKCENLATPFKDQIIFLGWRDDVPQLMRMADIFVLSSLSEGAPNVLMEASSSGLPVITTDVGEASQIVLNGKTGIVVLPKDINALSNAMEFLINDRVLAKKMGKAGRTRIEQYYSWDIICQKLENAYQKIISDFKARDSC